MPTAALKPCGKPGCGRLSPDTYCQQHKRDRRGSDNRPTAAARGYGHTWSKLRRMVLNRYPICNHPGCNRPSTVADHITPKRQGGENAFENLQGLCKRHHDIKTATQDGGFGRAP